MQDSEAVFEAAKAVLEHNDRGDYTMPASDLYPHQWLWDSCFTAIGLRHLDIDRAKQELRSLLDGQWHNGMLPNIIFRAEARFRPDRDAWRSQINPNAPDHVATSGITQPPMLAEAVVRVGQKLNLTERRQWYRELWPALLAYHRWLYAERDPHGEGLTLLIHPWEAGLDNTPPWTAALREHQLPTWIRLLKQLHLLPLIAVLRRDAKHIPLRERFATLEILALFDVQRRLRRKAYDINKILDHGLFTIEDLTFNCILVRANEHLIEMAKVIRREVPDDLQLKMANTRTAFDQLWDPYAKQYFSRDFITHQLIKEPSIAAFMPLYAGCVTQERAEEIVKLLDDEHGFGTDFPVPSVPQDSAYFDADRYWQGPTWVNTNWLVINGLERYGFTDHAAALRERTLEMVGVSGCAEYFNSLTGAPAGAKNFSWTAALTIDLLRRK